MMDPLTSTRISINVWYFVINIICVALMYAIDDSIVHHFSSYLLLSFHCVHVVSMMLYYITSWSNPGFVSFLQNHNDINIPSSRDTASLPSSYCKFCRFIRPPLSKHCVHCNRCVIRFDHHCGWIANCVGHRNHGVYLCYVASQVMVTVFILYVAAQSVFPQRDDPNDSNIHFSLSRFFEFTPLFLLYTTYKLLYETIWEMLIGRYLWSWTVMARWILFGGMFIAVTFAGSLLLWNLYLVFTNQTTLSFLRPQPRDNRQMIGNWTGWLTHKVIGIKRNLSGEIDAKYTTPLALDQPLMF